MLAATADSEVELDSILEVHTNIGCSVIESSLNGYGEEIVLPHQSQLRIDAISYRKIEEPEIFAISNPNNYIEISSEEALADPSNRARCNTAYMTSFDYDNYPESNPLPKIHQRRPHASFSANTNYFKNTMRSMQERKLV